MDKEEEDLVSELVPNNPVPSDLPATPPALPQARASILRTWLKAITRPSEKTYAAIAALPGARAGMAFVWVFLAALLEMVVYLLVLAPVQRDLQQALAGTHTVLPGATTSLLAVLCGAPVAAAAMLLWFMASSGIIHLVARAFSGKAAYGQWAYTMAAIFVPTALVSTVLLAFEALGTTAALCMGGLSLLLALYVIVIQVVAIKAVEQIGWGGAVVSILVLPALLICLSCAVIGVLMLMGPSIGNVFSSINQSLQTVP